MNIITLVCLCFKQHFQLVYKESQLLIDKSSGLLQQLIIMALSSALLIIATSLLVSQHVQGSGELDTSLTAPMCNTSQATAAMLACRASFLQSAGQNFTDDCDDGIVEEFMQCINSVQGCSNASGFLEKAFYDHYGCMDTRLRVQKRSFVRRFVCSIACGFSCGYGEWNSFSLRIIVFINVLKNFSTVCSFTGFGYPVCRYVCRRVCRRACRWVWQWISDRFGRSIAPEESNDLTPEEREYIDQTQNLCSDCVCSIGQL